MKCKFEGIAFGESVSFSGGKTCCSACGCDTQALVESSRWIYRGHSVGMDLLDATKPLMCPGCGENIIGHAEHCEANGTGLEIFFSEAVIIERKP